MDNNTLLGILISSICGCGLLGAVALLILGTIFKWPIGVKLGKSKCGNCGDPAPLVRAPTDLYETLWGGWTCQECGCKNDKWGRPRGESQPRRRKSPDRD